jgi:hypothetical protein
LPLPAVTELVIDPDGGCSPGFRWTVLQFGFEDEVEREVPSDEEELAELLLSA